jgi:tRNA (Thr-GGU) A37 N-methylase
MHEAEITQINGVRIRVRHLDAMDGTPILDIKPVLGQMSKR